MSTITVIHESPLNATVFGVNNGWQGPGSIPGQWLVVYAGESMVSQTPAMLVYAEPTDPNAANQYLTFVGMYSDARVTGSLTITSAQGSVLTVDATSAIDRSGVPSGDTTHLVFDATTGAFAGS